MGSRPPAPPVLALGHPDILQLLRDAADELVSWAPKGRGVIYFHDDGRDVSRDFRRFERAGFVHRCKGPRGRLGGSVELTAAGLLHLTESESESEAASA